MLDVDKQIKLDKEQLIKQAFLKILTYLTNTFYNKDPTNPINVIFNDTKDTNNFFDGQKIVLSELIVDRFGELNLPRFIVYYHELGHLLYSEGAFRLEEKWTTMTSGPLTWNPAYHHLFNWIEDFYIENQLKKEHSYLTDVLNCIKRIPPDYDITHVTKAFNYYYNYEAVTPALLDYKDQLQFKKYIDTLLSLREDKVIKFGYGVFTNLSIRPSNDTKFAMLLIEFYNWCVSKNIFDPQQPPLPALTNPNNTITQAPVNNPATAGTPTTVGTPQPNGPGAISAHSGKSQTSVLYVEQAPVSKAVDILKEELLVENRLIQAQLYESTQVCQADKNSIEGLFTPHYKISPVVQNNVKIENFYNPDYLYNELLFKKRLKSYMNVTIFRDISGSTSGETHALMHEVCEMLMASIPLDINYYLYSSGDISIIKVPYIAWPNSEIIPSQYQSDPLFKQLDGGTNSDAIADVITEQYDDRSLNIIITDGDLTALLARENIYALLKNVFVINVDIRGSHNFEQLLTCKVQDQKDIDNVLNTLAEITVDNRG